MRVGSVFTRTSLRAASWYSGKNPVTNCASACSLSAISGAAFSRCAPSALTRYTPLFSGRNWSHTSTVNGSCGRNSASAEGTLVTRTI